MHIFNPKEDKLNFKFEYNLDETQKLRDKFSARDKITIDDLRRVALWKINRVLDVPEDLLEKLNELALRDDLKYNDDFSRDIINSLVKCRGVGFPMVSSILKFIRPDIYPIIDVRAYRALYGKGITYSGYNVDIYFDYISKVYEIREKLDLELHEVDEQLYMFDKENNGKI